MPRSSGKPAHPTSKTKSTLWLTMVDTSWSMLVPSVVLVAGGIYLDLNIGTKPWLTIVGVILGLSTSGFLIKQLLEDTL